MMQKAINAWARTAMHLASNNGPEKYLIIQIQFMVTILRGMIQVFYLFKTMPTNPEAVNGVLLRTPKP